MGFETAESKITPQDGIPADRDEFSADPAEGAKRGPTPRNVLLPCYLMNGGQSRREPRRAHRAHVWQMGDRKLPVGPDCIRDYRGLGRARGGSEWGEMRILSIRTDA